MILFFIVTLYLNLSCLKLGIDYGAFPLSSVTGISLCGHN